MMKGRRKRGEGRDAIKRNTKQSEVSVKMSGKCEK